MKRKTTEHLPALDTCEPDPLGGIFSDWAENQQWKARSHQLDPFLLDARAQQRRLSEDDYAAKMAVALSPHPIELAPTRPTKKRRLSLKTQTRYSRVREIPRATALKEFCRRCDALQRPFPIPKEWQRDGCPSKWLDAWNDQRWRKKIHELKQNAWRSENMPENLV
jgi:hypothetical protein